MVLQKRLLNYSQHGERALAHQRDRRGAAFGPRKRLTQGLKFPSSRIPSWFLTSLTCRLLTAPSSCVPRRLCQCFQCLVLALLGLTAVYREPHISLHEQLAQALRLGPS